MSKHWYADYTASITNGDDKLTVNKARGCSWADIIMETDSLEAGGIMLRNREQAEQLHFMLGQLLERRDDE